MKIDTQKTSSDFRKGNLQISSCMIYIYMCTLYRPEVLQNVALIMDEVDTSINDSYDHVGRVGNVEEDIYEIVETDLDLVSLDSIPPKVYNKEDLNPEEVPVKVKTKVRVNCYAVVAILALVMAVFSLIVALVGVSYAPIELNNQQGRLSSSSQEVESQMKNLKQQIQILNEQCKSQIKELHAGLRDTNQNFQAQLNDSNQLIEMLQVQHIQNISAQENNSIILFQDVREIIVTVNKLHPASSCSDIPQYRSRLSGEYWITNSNGSPVQVYCDMDRTSCSCNTAGRWMRVANLDMTDPNQNCPDGFRLVSRTTPPLRTCGRPGPGCVSTTYPTWGGVLSSLWKSDWLPRQNSRCF